MLQDSQVLSLEPQEDYARCPSLHLHEEDPERCVDSIVRGMVGSCHLSCLWTSSEVVLSVRPDYP